jgi:hypothetical protein
LGVGGLGFGAWAPTPNPQSPIPIKNRIMLDYLKNKLIKINNFKK